MHIQIQFAVGLEKEVYSELNLPMLLLSIHHIEYIQTKLYFNNFYYFLECVLQVTF